MTADNRYPNAGTNTKVTIRDFKDVPWDILDKVEGREQPSTDVWGIQRMWDIDNDTELKGEVRTGELIVIHSVDNDVDDPDAGETIDIYPLPHALQRKIKDIAHKEVVQVKEHIKSVLGLYYPND